MLQIRRLFLRECFRFPSQLSDAIDEQCSSSSLIEISRQRKHIWNKLNHAAGWVEQVERTDDDRNNPANDVFPAFSLHNDAPY